LLPFTALIEYKAINKQTCLSTFLSELYQKKKQNKSAAAAAKVVMIINPTFVPTLRVFSF
jgi:hypothetical protein